MSLIDWEFLEKHKGEPDPWATGQVQKCAECGNRHEVKQQPCKEDDYFEQRYKALKSDTDSFGKLNNEYRD